jgi:hypothetical protein
VSQESAEDFCKHAHGIVRVTTRSVEQEVARPQEAAVEAVREALEDDLYQDPVQVCGIFYYAGGKLPTPFSLLDALKSLGYLLKLDA